MVDSVPATDGAEDGDEAHASRRRAKPRDPARAADAPDGDPIADPIVDPTALAAHLDPVPKKVVDAARRAWAHRRVKSKDTPPDE
jgi:hypothetical protein